MWVQYNANPNNNRTGDCVIRALSTILEQTWEKTYADLFYEGLVMKEMPSANNVWGAYLRKQGYEREAIPNTCPDCYTIEDFCRDNPTGDFVLALNGHAVAVKDGNYYDTWDCGNEIPLYYWRKVQ